jgi:hypothetical protein
MQEFGRLRRAAPFYGRRRPLGSRPAEAVRGLVHTGVGSFATL